MDIISIIREGGLFYLLLLIAVTMHEYGHAFIADKLGDPLPRLQGRVTVNPLAHMDMLGTVILPIITIFISLSTSSMIVFGWGKPVELSLSNPKTRDKVDLLSTAGGVGMNLVLAGISALFLGIFSGLNLTAPAKIAYMSIFMNCMLFVINMIPIPPLDGAHFLRYFTRMSYSTYAAIGRWGIIIFLVIINIPLCSQLISWFVTTLTGIYVLIANLVANIF